MQSAVQQRITMHVVSICVVRGAQFVQSGCHHYIIMYMCRSGALTCEALVSIASSGLQFRCLLHVALIGIASSGILLVCR